MLKNKQVNNRRQIFVRAVVINFSSKIRCVNLVGSVPHNRLYSEVTRAAVDTTFSNLLCNTSTGKAFSRGKTLQMQAEEYNRRGTKRRNLLYWLVSCALWCYSTALCSGKELVDYITQYLLTIRERNVVPDVKPGYMKGLLPDTAPAEPEDWDTVFKDVERIVMPGVCFQFYRVWGKKFWSLRQERWNFCVFPHRWFTGRALTCMLITLAWLHGPPCSGRCCVMLYAVSDLPG